MNNDTKTNIAFISLGCDKNRVDSEVMLGIMEEADLKVVTDESEADLIVINTCCFIKDALEESIETILEMAKYKEEGRCKGIIVAGCLGQRYEKEIFEEMPEIDAVVGTTAYEKIVEAAKRVLAGEKELRFLSPIDAPMDEKNAPKRILSTPGYYAYLKISEGCDNFCTYCVIPKLRGKHRSRTIESLVLEAKALAKSGVKELIIVAQDTSIYGRDIYGTSKLHELLNALCEVDGIEWIRLLYCYPETLTQETIDVMSMQSKICKYIDMPIQHGTDAVLKRMGRRSSKELIEKTVARLRLAMADICIRTTLIVGFPGESDAEFEELCDFVSRMKFDRLGVFTYSPEDGTPAANMADQIDEDIKEERKNTIMEIQKTISAHKCEEVVDSIINVLVEGKLPEENVYCARSFRDAPDIDGLVFVNSDYELFSGDFIPVMVTEASDYDLIGEAYYGDEFTE